MEKILSIIIPSYNMDKYLDKCLSSLLIDDVNLMQLLEVLIINDGSKDRTSEIGHLYANQYPESFRIIDKENGNYGSCINRGLKEANGKYVKVLDADDYFDTARFADYLDFLRKFDGDVLLTDFKRIDESSENEQPTTLPLPQNQLINVSDLDYNVIVSIWMHQITYKLEILKKIDYKQTEGISYTDQEWIYLPMGASKTIFYLPCFLYMYLVGREGQTINPKIWEKNFWMEIKGTEVMLEEYHNVHDNNSMYNINYLQTRLKIRCLTIFTVYILRFDSEYNKEIIERFDTLLKQKWPSIYTYLDEQKINQYIPFHHVRYWRNTGVKYPPYWFLIKTPIRIISLWKRFVKSF